MQIQYTKTGETKHSDACTRVFKNYDMSCPRCQELAQGSKARGGWQKSYYENKKRNDAVFSAHLKAQHCEHGVFSLNPGGYCNVCGKGTDFS